MANGSRYGSSVVLVVGLLVAYSATVRSQSTRVANPIRLGTVQEIKPIRQSVCPDSAVPGGLFVTLQRGSVIAPVGRSLPQTLFLNTTIVVGRGNDARLRIDNPDYGQGWMILAPLLPCPGWAGWKGGTIIEAVGREAGVYRLSPLPDSAGKRREGLELRVDRGGAFIQWDKNIRRPLIVFGGKGPYMKPIGTEFVVAVDSSRGTLLYVKSGSVGFEGSTVVATAGQLYAVLPEGPRQLSSLTQRDMGQLRSDLAYHADEIWQSPPTDGAEARTGRSWGRIVGATAVLGGAVYGGYKIWERNNKRKPSTQGNGTVILRIPI